ncbi:hypothetical protein [Candidatus Uabimicrobium sp. HlEnr_7]|uniref:hypothetical protein n=1 Tax=Candidatus Uabimicrobium helgolandensis TaxID=3095367 RepID=UPI0035584450
MKVYLHIGTYKTGTSAIQRFLHSNRQKLLEYNIVYPEFKQHKYAHHMLAWSYMPHKKDLQKSTISFKDIVSYMEKYPQKTLLLSSEMFYAIEDIQKLQNDLQTLEIFPKIIVYLRRQDYWLESRYNQITKSPRNNKAGFVDTLKNIELNWFTRLQKWEQAFGRENLIVKAYEKQQMPQGLIINFLHILNITQMDAFQMPTKKINTSLDLDLLELKRLLNTMNYPVELSTLNEINENLQPFSQKLFSFEERQKIIKKYTHSNCQIAERYLNRKTLFYDDFPNNKNQYKQYNGLQLEKAIALFISITKAQQKQLQIKQQLTLQNKTKRYKKKLRRAKRLSVIFGILLLLKFFLILYLLYLIAYRY